MSQVFPQNMSLIRLKLNRFCSKWPFPCTSGHLKNRSSDIEDLSHIDETVEKTIKNNKSPVVVKIDLEKIIRNYRKIMKTRRRKRSVKEEELYTSRIFTSSDKFQKYQNNKMYKQQEKVVQMTYLYDFNEMRPSADGWLLTSQPIDVTMFENLGSDIQENNNFFFKNNFQIVKIILAISGLISLLFIGYIVLLHILNSRELKK